MFPAGEPCKRTKQRGLLHDDDPNGVLVWGGHYPQLLRPGGTGTRSGSCRPFREGG